MYLHASLHEGNRPSIVRLSDLHPFRGRGNEAPIGRLRGVDVIITIFGDFCQFATKKLAFFSETNVMIKILHNLALFCVKNANFFAEFFGENFIHFFGENILKIIT
jgi:hypothetical protein